MRRANKGKARAFTRSEQACKTIAQSSSKTAALFEDIQNHERAIIVVLARYLPFRRSFLEARAKGRQTQRSTLASAGIDLSTTKYQ